jgi:hypothetical protein
MNGLTPLTDDTYQQMLKYITTKFPDLTGIVYCMTKADCEETADFLRANKVRFCAWFYNPTNCRLLICRLVQIIIMPVNPKLKGRLFKRLGYKVKLKLCAPLLLTEWVLICLLFDMSFTSH